MSTSSVSKPSNLEYYVTSLEECLRRALNPLESFVPLSFPAQVVSIICGFFSSTRLVDEGCEDPSSSLELTQNSISDITKWYSKHALNITHKRALDTHLKTKVGEYTEKLLLSLSKDAEFINHTRNSKIPLFVAINHEEPNVPIRFETFGVLSPIVRIRLPQIEVKNQEQLHEVLRIFSELNFDENSRKVHRFKLSHEFSHIQHQDQLWNIAFKVVQSLISLYPWIRNYSQALSWPSYLGMSYAYSVTLNTLYIFCQNFFSRYQELRADKGAMDLLEDNEIAILTFNHELKIYDEGAISSSHPSFSERLAQALSWKK